MGAILWLTGVPGAGKTTLALAIGPRLAAEGPVEILDGDQMRTHLSRDLGFSKDDRDTNVRRIGFVARMLARHGILVVVAAIGLAALLLQLRLRKDLGTPVRAPLWLNVLGLIFAVTAVVADILHLSANVVLVAAPGSVLCFAISSTAVLRALRKN